MDQEPGEITRLLHRWRSGDTEVESQLFEVLLPDLQRMARRQFRNESPGHTLQPSALVNEAFLRLVQSKNVDWQDRHHFLAIAARIMRRFLAEHARSRPDLDFVSLDRFPGWQPAALSPGRLTMAVDDLLVGLERDHPQWCRVVELKYFLGLTDSEAAETLGLSLHTLQREWYRARQWLFERLDVRHEQCGA